MSVGAALSDDDRLPWSAPRLDWGPFLIEGGLARVRFGTGHSLAGRVIRIRRIRLHELLDESFVMVADFDGPARDGRIEYWARWTLSLASLEPVAGKLAPGMVIRPLRERREAGR
ncbi:MAG: hypothetical protein MI920_18795 [Kiloniellales bacterium]|nr:hypothetical protein [Kiloniellales bacterium]